MIKVNHAGENGAVNIYRSQYLAASFRARQLLPHLTQCKKHEMEHRRIFADYLSKNGLRKCVSYHLCGIGGFSLGLLTGLIGKNAIAATTYAVENVVLEHLEDQLVYLKEHEPAAHKCVSAIYDDEKSHHDNALEQLDQHSCLSRALVAIVKWSTEQIIWFGMR